MLLHLEALKGLLAPAAAEKGSAALRAPFVM